MNSLDLINKIAVKHNITSGRAEMIISIIVERIIERLKKDGAVTINNFGEFKISKKNVASKFNEPLLTEMNQISFEPSKNFLENINSLI